jgi:peptide-methionine (S)-S-oxide reductase
MMATTADRTLLRQLHRATAVLAMFVSAAGVSCSPQSTEKGTTMRQTQTPIPPAAARQTTAEGTELATFGGGCFWCVEAVFQQLQGVVSVESGYAGGTVVNPTYKQVCTGTTGHAEVCQIRFDPAKITYDELLEVFWQTHDPTTLNRQGNDVGTQYRSVIFYHNEAQRQTAEQRKQQLDAAGAWPQPIVTAIEPLTSFFKAEAYHQDYYRTNPEQGYCRAVIQPKIEKFRKVFAAKLK